MEETVVIDVDLEIKKIYFDERYTLPWIHLAYLRGKEIHFTTKITFNANTGEAHPIHESFSSWDEGTINRETGELKVVNYSKQEGDRGFEFGFEKKYLCK